MKLEITNFAKIKKADIEIKGITVIAGDNNTGKTTVGRTLFSVYNSVYNIGEKVDVSRRQAIFSKFRFIYRQFLSNSGSESDRVVYRRNVTRRMDMALRRFYEGIKSEDIPSTDADKLVDTFMGYVEEEGVRLDDDTYSKMTASLKEDIERINNTDDKVISVEIINQFFQNVFSDQVYGIDRSADSKIKLTIHGNDTEFVFKNSECISWTDHLDLIHEAFFIDDPFVMNSLNCFDTEELTYTSKFLIDKLSKTSGENFNAINSVLAKEKLKEIVSALDNIVSENIQYSEGEWVVLSDSSSEPLSIDNVSAGVKSFMLLKAMLKGGILKEKDVLILDEPEIHLHPEWQIKYAEIIVLLQKYFDLSILVTTHSRDFLEAIDLYSKKHSIVDFCRYYITDSTDEGVLFLDVTNDTAEMYRHLITPSRILDKLRFELEEQ